MGRGSNGQSRLVVIGGDAAGMSAASQARRHKSSAELEILALEAGEHTSYSACGIPYFVAATVPEAQDLVVRDPATFAHRHHIEVRTRCEVTKIDLDRRVVRTAHADGSAGEEPFDQLMLATGALPRRPDLPGADAEGVFGVQTLTDGIELRAEIEERAPRRAVVVGGGYIGLEMAEAFLQRGMVVDLIEALPEPMSTLDPDMGGLVREALREMGVNFHPNTPVTGFEAPEGRVRAVHTAGGGHEADIVVLGLGTRPNSDLARAAGIAIGPTGGVAVDARMRTSAPGVWAAGDCVETFHRVSRAPVAIALGTHANKQGRVAGDNIGGGYARFPGVVGTALTKVCGLEVARTGLNEAQAHRAAYMFDTVTVESSTRAGYYPGAGAITVKLLAERGSGRLLGGQIVGCENAGKRIDVLATALWNEMTVADMAGMDLGYAPPFAPVWDPVLIAARKLAERR
ncbi:FAD-dependent oxidoreductase [Salinactinospora qingdaonensis]|uniref:FAD-dependent oxidoreductase n=1 Tax=Salinactinospora qingdaonensis TaxID=702744 RepID=A0ABP7F5Y7_9ACTN